jgi:hypothetical protein
MAEHLALVWSAADRGVAKNMVFMYAKNSLLKGWWPAVTLIVWGPSAELLARDAELQEELEELRAAGVELVACRACADNYGVAANLGELGVEVKYMGEPLTGMLKEGWKVLTF